MCYRDEVTAEEVVDGWVERVYADPESRRRDMELAKVTVFP